MKADPPLEQENFFAFLDESDGRDSLTVAGFIVSAEQLPHLVREWGQLLNTFGIQSFHMVEFAHSRGEFKGWKESRRKELMEKILGIVSRRVRIQIGAVIDKEAFESALIRSEIFRTLYPDPYTAACLMTMIKAGSWAKKWRHRSPIDYTVDRGNRKRTDFQSGFDIATEAGLGVQYNLGLLTFADDREVLPLQLADFIAYESQKVYVDYKAGKVRFRHTLLGLMKGPNSINLVSAACLEKLAVDLSEEIDIAPKPRAPLPEPPG